MEDCVIHAPTRNVARRWRRGNRQNLNRKFIKPKQCYIRVHQNRPVSHIKCCINQCGNPWRTMTTENNGQIKKTQANLKTTKSIKAGWLQPFVIRRRKRPRRDLFEEAKVVKYWSEISKMLQWLIFLTLFVQSSIAFGLYDDIDGKCYLI